MGRELKRVPLDFDWPHKKVWHGYLDPYLVDCDGCAGTGETRARRQFVELVNLLMLAGGGPHGHAGHPYFDSVPVDLPLDPGLAQVTAGLAGRAPRLMGHDACDRWAAVKKILAAAGLPEEWGACPKCYGEGIPPEYLAKSEAWEPTEPPEGEGYQLWGTTSEGAPVSPVFETLDALCAWAEEHATTFGRSKASAAQWRKMLEDGLVYAEENGVTFI